MAKKRKKSTRKRRQPTDQIDRIERPLTLVAQVEKTLRRAVIDGVFFSGRLPSSVELAEQFGVSRETVRLALESMQDDGLVVKHRRRGTLINPPSLPTRLEPTSKILGYLQADYSQEQGEPEVITRATSSYMFDGALVEAGNAGYQLVARSARILNLRTAFDELSSQVRLRGMIFASIAEEKLLRQLSGLHMPVVLLDHDLHLGKLSSIRPDSADSAKLAVSHLAELGHRRIALAQWHQDDLNPWRVRGYREGMREVGLRCRRTWEVFVRITRDGAAKVVNTILQTSPQPTAVICFSNALASFVIDAAHERGLRVPEDLSVIGGGGGDVVGLTCVQLNWYDLGRQAMRLLLEAIEAGQGHRPEHVVAPYRLQTGRTTTRPKSL
jgi:DNA-binding LacI/PurR family transcriptional regulator